jgi:hypothetical protein
MAYLLDNLNGIVVFIYRNQYDKHTIHPLSTEETKSVKKADKY